MAIVMNPQTMSKIQLADYMAEEILTEIGETATWSTSLGDVLVKVMPEESLRQFAQWSVSARVAWIQAAAADGRVVGWLNGIAKSAKPKQLATGTPEVWTQTGFTGGKAHRAQPTDITIGRLTIVAGPIHDIARLESYTLLLDLTGNFVLNTPPPPVPLIQGSGELFTHLAPLAPPPPPVHHPQSFVSLKWSDMGVYPASADFWRVLADSLAAVPGHILGVGCTAGLGRTGTTLAILARIEHGLNGPDAIAWVRSHYNASAVETKEQQAYVAALSL